MTYGYEINKKWRKRHPKIYQAGKKRYYARGREYDERRFKKWTKKERRLILFSRKPDRQLAKKLKRSIQAIHAQRTMIKTREYPIN